MSETSAARSVRTLCEQARVASRAMALADRRSKDRALGIIATRLRSGADQVLEANRADVEKALVAAGDGRINAAFVDRLRLDARRLESVAAAVDQVQRLDDPVGEICGMKRRPNGLLVGQVRVPLGVIAMVYEARPNVTIDAAVLCIKSGNAVVLRGGSEASKSNGALADLVRSALAEAGLPQDAVQALPAGDREGIKELLSMTGLVDLAIPRGGEGLVRFVAENARVPVLQHYKGVCHLYVDEGYDHEAGVRLVNDGKTVRPGVCNALECLLVHEREAKSFLPKVAKMASERNLELRGCPSTVAIVPTARPATPADFGREFLDLILAVKVVSNFDEALGHVARYGSGHTEVIATPSYENAQRWLREVDASCVLVNASTRFNDGGELGLGAELGISTSKLHAYGPMGLVHLTTQKWIVYGEGQIRG